MWDFALLHTYLRYRKPEVIFFFPGARGADSRLHTGAWAKLLARLSKYEPLAGDRLHPPDSQSCYLSVFWITRAGWQLESGRTKAYSAKHRNWSCREASLAREVAAMKGEWCLLLSYSAFGPLSCLGFTLPEVR